MRWDRTAARRASLSDMRNKVVYALGDRLRVAGMVDIGDRDAGIGGRIHQLRAGAALSAAPGAGQRTRGMGRPAAGAADGKPLIGRTPVRGLWINAGHGALSAGAGSAGVLADRIAGRPYPDTLFQW